MFKVGDTAPSFCAKDQAGNDVTLEGLSGQRLVIWFYPKADTPG